MMRHLLFIMTLLAVVALTTSCTDDDPVYRLTLDKQELTFPAQGDVAQVITVEAENVSWDIADADEWIYPVKSGNTISVTVDDYYNGAQTREGTFTVTSDNNKAPDITVKITQTTEQLVYTLEASATELEFWDAFTEPKAIAITAENLEWDIELNDGTGWLHVTKGEGVITVSADDNAGAMREAKFRITSNVESIEPIEVTVSQKEGVEWSVFLTAYGAEHKGDDQGVGADRFIVNLDMIEYDPETYMPLNDGVILTLDFFSQTPADLMNPDIATGTYTVSETNEVFTARAWHTYMMVIENGGMVGYRSAQSGYFIVEKSGSEYEFRVSLTVTDDWTQEEFQFNGYWKGELPVKNQFLSVLNSDVTLPEMTGGNITFYGEYYWGVEAYDWEVKLWSDGMASDEFGNLSGTGHQIDLEFLTPFSGSTTILPEGVYPLNSSMQAGTAISGHVDFLILSCWYLEMKDGMVLADGLKYAPLISGNITVAYSDGDYTITIDATDDLGYKITGSYTGPLNYKDEAYYGSPKKPGHNRQNYIRESMEKRSDAVKRK